jgi:hypothetical protein
MTYRLPDGRTSCEIVVANGAGAGQVVAVSLNGRTVPVSDGVARVRLPDGGGACRVDLRLG